jgi:hypothetical protein
VVDRDTSPRGRKARGMTHAFYRILDVIDSLSCCVLPLVVVVGARWCMSWVGVRPSLFCLFVCLFVCFFM